MSGRLCRQHDTFRSFAGGWRPGAGMITTDHRPARKQLIVGLTEIDSEIGMEYGLILPRPGDEPAWFADNAAALDGI